MNLRAVVAASIDVQTSAVKRIIGSILPIALLRAVGQSPPTESTGGSCEKWPPRLLVADPARVNLPLLAYILGAMSDVTEILNAARAGDQQAASQLLPLGYDELRRLAARDLSREAPGQTLDATALVHEVYLKLVGPADARRWNDRRH